MLTTPIIVWEPLNSVKPYPNPNLRRFSSMAASSLAASACCSRHRAARRAKGGVMRDYLRRGLLGLPLRDRHASRVGVGHWVGRGLRELLRDHRHELHPVSLSVHHAARRRRWHVTFAKWLAVAETQMPGTSL